jgi:rhamnopyranosyl-N-acetylglucosaminyl-diphospho-decaprenol beta-1,3/1,4-galactofuranosyltransferase
MRIAAVVVTYQRPQLLQLVVAALHRQQRAPDRIIIVDNGCDAATAAVIPQLGDVELLRSGANLGGAGGFALGIDHAHAAGFDWIWLLDDDAIPRAQALHALECAAVAAPRKTGALCGAVREFGDLALQHRRCYQRWSGREKNVAREAYRGASRAIDSASFVGFLIAAPAVSHVGLPNAAYFVSYDDTEYSLRLGHAGWGVRLVADSIIDHARNSADRLRAAPFGRKHYFNIRNRIAVARAYGRPRLPPMCVSALWGVALWLANRQRWSAAAPAILRQAVADGWHGRLGPYPEHLVQREAQAARERADRQPRPGKSP